MAATSSSLAEGSAVPVFFLPSFTVECEGDFMVVGMKSGEVVGTIVRLVCTLVTVSITSSWFGGHKVKRLLLFFSHWLRSAWCELPDILLLLQYVLCCCCCSCLVVGGIYASRALHLVFWTTENRLLTNKFLALVVYI